MASTRQSKKRLPINRKKPKKTGDVPSKSYRIHVTRKGVNERKMLQEALRASEKKFRDLAEESRVGIYLVQGGLFRYVNPRLAEIFGYTVAELIGVRGPKDLTLPDDWPMVEDKLNGRLQHTVDWVHHGFRGIHKSGHVIYVEVYGSRTEYEGRAAVIGSLLDITESKQAQDLLTASEERYRSLVEGSSDAILTLGTDRTIVSCNAAFLRLFGYERAEVQGKSTRLLHASDESFTAFGKMGYPAVQRENSIRTEWELISKDGQPFPVEQVTSWIRGKDGQITGYVAVIRDISERIRALEALKQSEKEALRLAQETAVIAEIGRVISSSIDIEEVYERFAEEVQKLIPFDRILVNLANQPEGTLTTAYTAGMEVAGRKKGRVFPIAGTITEEMIRTDAPVLYQPESFEDVHKRFPGLVAAFEAGLRSRLSVLLTARGEVIGSLALWSKRANAYGEQDIRLAKSVAGQIAGAIANAQLFLERKRAEEALRESEHRYRMLFENMTVGFALHEMIYDDQGKPVDYRFIEINPAFEKLTGVAASALLGKTVKEVLPNTEPYWIEVGGEVARTGEPMAFENYSRELGRYYDTWLFSPGKDRFAVVFSDITLRKRAEDELRASEERFRSLVETTSDWIWETDWRGVYTYASPKVKDLLGYEPFEVVGKRPLDLMPPEEAERVAPIMRQHFENALPFLSFENVALHRDGHRVLLETNGVPVFDDVGQMSGYRGIDRNITERKRADEQIKTSLQEKEVLLKEIHHRVKNNLQIISSLLYLQANKTEHPGALSALRDSQSRVRSMALVHERLYRSPSLASVDMGEYTKSLVSYLKQTYQVEGNFVRLTLTVEDIALDISEAIPCGLIINELLSNALKHAFPDGKGGEITIRLTRSDKGDVTLMVGDSGVGLPEQLDYRNSPSLGLTLVNSLVKQLEGTIELDSKSGTTFTIAFKRSG